MAASGGTQPSNSYFLAKEFTETTLLWIGKEPSYLDDGFVDSFSVNYKETAYSLDGMQSLRIAVKLIAQSVVEDMEQGM